MEINDSLILLSLTQSEIDAITSPVESSMVYNSDAKKLQTFNGTGWENSGGVASINISTTPPADTSKLWFNEVDSLIYFYNGTYWLSSNVYSTTFNEPGNTPNNTWFRVGNTVSNFNGIGQYLEFDSYLVKLTYNRNPNTAKLGNYWLYSNSLTGTQFASVVATFTVPADAGGESFLSTPVIINAGSYISLRWNGLQTNNNICVLKYRKKYT